MKALLKENEIPCCDTMFKVHDLVKTGIMKKNTSSTGPWPSMARKY
jgi:hypothetical protein